jgi:hypothetical protein
MPRRNERPTELTRGCAARRSFASLNGEASHASYQAAEPKGILLVNPLQMQISFKKRGI